MFATTWTMVLLFSYTRRTAAPPGQSLNNKLPWIKLNYIMLLAVNDNNICKIYTDLSRLWNFIDKTQLPAAVLLTKTVKHSSIIFVFARDDATPRTRSEPIADRFRTGHIVFYAFNLYNIYHILYCLLYTLLCRTAQDVPKIR